MAEQEKLIQNTTKLISGFNALNIDILVTQQYTKGLGETITPVKDLLKPFNYSEKLAFSCCDDSAFFNTLTDKNKKNVILFGIESHVCVLQTTIDLIEKGYTPIVIEDCISSRNLNDKKIALKRMEKESAIISTVESVLFELTRYAGTEEFKAISKIVR
jgi:isochorismate hydrolase